MFMLLTSCVSNTKLYSCYQCPDVDLVDMSDGAADPRDRPAYNRAVFKCSQEVANTCLVQFTRIEPGDYHAVCGKPREAICRK